MVSRAFGESLGFSKAITCGILLKPILKSLELVEESAGSGVTSNECVCLKATRGADRQHCHSGKHWLCGQSDDKIQCPTCRRCFAL